MMARQPEWYPPEIGVRHRDTIEPDRPLTLCRHNTPWCPQQSSAPVVVDATGRTVRLRCAAIPIPPHLSSSLLVGMGPSIIRLIVAEVERPWHLAAAVLPGHHVPVGFQLFADLPEGGHWPCAIAWPGGRRPGTARGVGSHPRTSQPAGACVADLAGTINVSVRATAQAGFDRLRLQNGVLEPLRETKLLIVRPIERC